MEMTNLLENKELIDVLDELFGAREKEKIEIDGISVEGLAYETEYNKHKKEFSHVFVCSDAIYLVNKSFKNTSHIDMTNKFID